MIYKRIQKGRFLKRPNRFIAKIEINGKEETVHVKNTGRCANFWFREQKCMSRSLKVQGVRLAGT